MLPRKQAQPPDEVVLHLERNIIALRQVKSRLTQEIQVLLSEREKLREDVSPPGFRFRIPQTFSQGVLKVFQRIRDKLVLLWRGLLDDVSVIQQSLAPRRSGSLPETFILEPKIDLSQTALSRNLTQPNVSGEVNLAFEKARRNLSRLHEELVRIDH